MSFAGTEPRGQEPIWRDAGDLNDLKAHSLCPKVLGGMAVILLLHKGQVYCFKDECSHQPVPLSEFGELVDNTIICHAHGGQFDLDCPGKAKCFPVVSDLIAFRTRLDGHSIKVLI
ncbi:MAG: Rieske 2Fe-2S domain-containing protein [Proteobacteria bacterium]|nr:Rieske 2Fe-2S domain-containing protein [Pseudomonadota bacterium]